MSSFHFQRARKRHVIVVTRGLLKNVVEMGIKGVSADKSQDAKTLPPMATEPLSTFLQSENITTAPPPQLACLLMAALISDARPRFHQCTRHAIDNANFHQPVLAYKIRLANLVYIIVISVSSFFTRCKSRSEAPWEAEGIHWSDRSIARWEVTRTNE